MTWGYLAFAFALYACLSPGIVFNDVIVCSLDQHPEISAPKLVLGTDLLAMRHHAQLADLVDVLAVDINIDCRRPATGGQSSMAVTKASLETSSSGRFSQKRGDCPRLLNSSTQFCTLRQIRQNTVCNT